MTKILQIPITEPERTAMWRGAITMLSRIERHGDTGDLFRVAGTVYKLGDVYRMPLGTVADSFYREHGDENAEGFRGAWLRSHPWLSEFDHEIEVWVHEFRAVKDGGGGE